MKTTITVQKNTARKLQILKQQREDQNVEETLTFLLKLEGKKTFRGNSMNNLTKLQEANQI